MDCALCSFSTTRKSSWDRHVKTKYHREAAGLVCICEKTYASLKSLHRHEKTCAKRASLETNSHLERIAQGQKHLADSLAERDKAQAAEIERLRAEVASRPVNVINATNCTFNLNVFLNERCKSAQTIDQFIDGIELCLDPNQSMGQHLIDNLARCEVEKRPIHCTDTKRCKLAIKNSSETWEQDPAEVDPLLQRNVNKLRERYMGRMEEWCHLNPSYRTDDKVSDQWHKLFTMICADLDEKFVSQVAKVTQIPK